MFQLDLKSRKSIYEQIVDKIKELILTEVLTPNEKLPSVRELSKTLTVNPNTILKSYRELEKDGYVYTIGGSGCFVAEKKDRNTDKWKLEELKHRIQNDIMELQYLGLQPDEITGLIKQFIEKGVFYHD
ncbi:GntR family transcriptional regulator [Sinanaerobacter sp. ZZT-01]|uniref:GntR family transcriptional regulator n=1 Tax=Sinanaerobacter sp. ZZT-01 TaxID=3111540 RepID=UPI002D7959BE|nr:GntR family transcriptional regulator [Sinanaerobacter sp. ZZT-01]WRR92808.1 GntR family transcriptional regulator [Sinanaerobacter sp. ZZT-01]